MISLSKPIITPETEQAVLEVLRSGHIVQGPQVAQLETAMAKLCGTKYAVAVNSGTAALHTALYALHIQPGDEVITTPFTFVASVNAILMVGATPVFVDIQADTYNIDPAKIEKAITPKTKAILIVNIYGQPADYDEIKKIAKKHSLFIIEDAAQSINARYKTKKSGALGDISCFSFYASKNITSAEGGMLTTNHKKLYTKAKSFRQHGLSQRKRYTYLDIGYNYRMTDVHAAIALSQLKQIDPFTHKRIATATKYSKALKDILGITHPFQAGNRTHVFHQYTLRIEKNYKIKRDELKQYLKSKGIQSEIYYPAPLNTSLHLKKYIQKNETFPIAAKAAKEVLSIPVHPSLTEKEVNYIIETLLSL